MLRNGKFDCMMNGNRGINTAADVAPVVHGRWKWETGDIYRCTNCNGKAHVKEVMNRPAWDFCPNCGVRMDGDGDG